MPETISVTNEEHDKKGNQMAIADDCHAVRVLHAILWL